MAKKGVKKATTSRKIPSVVTNYRQLDNTAKSNIGIAIGQFLAEEAKRLIGEIG